MSQQMIAILITVLLTMIKYAVFDEEAKKSRLGHDKRALIHIGLGIPMLLVGLWLPTSGLAVIAPFAPLPLIIGANFITFGVLVLLSETKTLMVLDWHFIVGVSLFVIAAYALINLLVVTLGPSFGVMWIQVSAAYDAAWALSAHAIGIFLSGAGVYSLVVIAASIVGVIVGWNLFFRNPNLTKK